jgi:hypothetical protein
MTYDIVEKKPKDTIDLETAIGEEHIIGFRCETGKSFTIQIPSGQYTYMNYKYQSLKSRWGSEFGTLHGAVDNLKKLGFTIVKSFTTYGEASEMVFRGLI